MRQSLGARGRVGSSSKALTGWVECLLFRIFKFVAGSNLEAPGLATTSERFGLESSKHKSISFKDLIPTNRIFLEEDGVSAIPNRSRAKNQAQVLLESQILLLGCEWEPMGDSVFEGLTRFPSLVWNALPRSAFRENYENAGSLTDTCSDKVNHVSAGMAPLCSLSFRLCMGRARTFQAVSIIYPISCMETARCRGAFCLRGMAQSCSALFQIMI